MAQRFFNNDAAVDDRFARDTQANSAGAFADRLPLNHRIVQQPQQPGFFTQASSSRVVYRPDFSSVQVNPISRGSGQVEHLRPVVQSVGRTNQQVATPYRGAFASPSGTASDASFSQEVHHLRQQNAMLLRMLNGTQTLLQETQGKLKNVETRLADAYRENTTHICHIQSLETRLRMTKQMPKLAQRNQAVGIRRLGRPSHVLMKPSGRSSRTAHNTIVQPSSSNISRTSSGDHGAMQERTDAETIVSSTKQYSSPGKSASGDHEPQKPFNIDEMLKSVLDSHYPA